jgi:histidine triad (HIT) family protein
MSLNTPYDPDNIFAKILRGDLPCAKVYEDERVFSFMDAFPQTQGHTLVIPKAPAVNLFDISPKDLRNLISQTQRIARAVQAAFNADGIQLIQYNGTAAGQSVFHLHFHIIPFMAAQPPRAHGNGDMVPLSELNVLSEQIKANL